MMEAVSLASASGLRDDFQAERPSQAICELLMRVRHALPSQDGLRGLKGPFIYRVWNFLAVPTNYWASLSAAYEGFQRVPEPSHFSAAFCQSSQRRSRTSPSSESGQSCPSDQVWVDLLVWSSKHLSWRSVGPQMSGWESRRSNPLSRVR